MAIGISSFSIQRSDWDASRLRWYRAGRRRPRLAHTGRISDLLIHRAIRSLHLGFISSAVSCFG